VVATRSGSGVVDFNQEMVTSGWPSALIRSAARNSRSVCGSIEQHASTSPLAEVRNNGRPVRRRGNTTAIMKLAVCSMSSTANRNPPSEILAMPAVAARPT
jgi:hypothetical protein